MTRRRDQSLLQSPAHDPGLKETAPSAEIQEELFNLLQTDARDLVTSKLARTTGASPV